ncbi:spindle assembly abnormal protein 6 homolog [Aplysia californica]|uniref:Spindle assembly abnormal protein 6 homolog n=1 Tax=Aplysia californica TaxID=6500 RepID=A0ABM0ZXJ5_APLCA|nr:spindle assembly abnormal protein 6 homolog [Aplysia californica]
MEEIFCKVVPFFFKPSDREERKANVRVQMGYDSRHDSKKELVVKLTNDQDLYFLYTLHLAEEDFQSLKIQQGLLVDFTAFPQKVIDLLVMCIREDEKENPKFVLQFIEGGSAISACNMNIVETNPFRHLNHLSLKFLPGSDGDIKTHLVTCLKQLKESYNVIQQKFEHTSQDLSGKLHETQQLLSSKSSELESLKQEWSSRLSEVSTRHKEDMTLEKEKAIQFQSSLQMRFEKEKRELEQTHAKTVKQLETRLSELEASTKDLTDCKYRSESTIRECRGKLGVLDEENRRLKTELQSTRQENSSLDNARLDMDKSHNALQTRAAVLEQELRDKGELLEKSSDLLSSEKEKKKRAEAEVERRQKEVSRLENKVKAMGEELKKGNEIIKKLQGEIKSYHAKVKLRTQIATEQEKLLGEKEQELEKTRQELAVTKDKLRDFEDKNEKLTTNLESATQKLEESKKLLKTNENMIQWLNKQINEQRVSQVQHGTFEIPSGHTRPPLSGMHNFSASSHGSVVPHDDGRTHSASLRQRPGFGGSHQVQYQPVMETPVVANGPGSSAAPVRQSGLPVPITSTVSHNGISPRSGEGLNSSGGNKQPAIDPKFLMRREEAIPVRGALSTHSSLVYAPTTHNATNHSTANSSAAISVAGTRTTPPAASSAATTASQSVPSARPLPPHLLPSGPVRLSQEMIVPRSQPPLASAYFPKS